MGESFSFSPHFQAQIVVLALRIAEHQRGESKLQDVNILREKYVDESVELEESTYPPEEITDVLYYAVCLNAKGSPEELKQVEEYLPFYKYSQTQIEAATLVKFQLRAAGANTKDKQAERKAIQAAIDEV